MNVSTEAQTLPGRLRRFHANLEHLLGELASFRECIAYADPGRRGPWAPEVVRAFRIYDELAEEWPLLEHFANGYLQICHVNGRVDPAKAIGFEGSSYHEAAFEFVAQKLEHLQDILTLVSAQIANRLREEHSAEQIQELEHALAAVHIDARIEGWAKQISIVPATDLVMLQLEFAESLGLCPADDEEEKPLKLLTYAQIADLCGLTERMVRDRSTELGAPDRPSAGQMPHAWNATNPLVLKFVARYKPLRVQST